MPLNKLQSLWRITVGGTVGFFAFNIYKGNDKFYENLYSFSMPLIHQFVDPETAHRLAIKAAKYRVGTRLAGSEIVHPNLMHAVWNIPFDSPIGLAAGFDKNGEAVVGMADIGFSFVEIGSITPEPQTGNDKPRVFRLPNNKSIINRYGFNSEGMNQVKHNLIRARTHLPKFVIGVNLGKNKTSVQAVDDYLAGLKTFAHLASYFVINISSPNTPGLRNLQNKQELNHLLASIQSYRKSNKELLHRPLLVKIAPDLTAEQEREIAELIVKHKVDGLIVCNTTVRRDVLAQPEAHADETGGLSGLALRDMSTALIGRMYQLTKGRIPIIGVGGVFNAEDAYNKMRAGASLVQLYSSLAYHGPPLINQIKQDLSELIKKQGYSNVKDIIGLDHRK